MNVFFGLRIIVVVTIVALFATSCVPYPVVPDVEQFEEVRLADDIVVSAGPRRLLEQISDRLEEGNEELTVVDPIVFRDAAFPEGGWRIDELLQPGRCQQIAQELDVRFLVLIGGGTTRERDEMGIMMPLFLPAGAMMGGMTSVLSAVVIDLERGEATCRLRSQAKGITVGLVWVAPVAILPLTDQAAKRGLANSILEELTDEGLHGPVRIAVLAAVASGYPFASYEGAPISTGRDTDVIEMVERLSNLEDDIVVGITRREEIRKRLGAPLASHSAMRVEIYRFTALARRKVRPLILFAPVRWATREERSYTGYLLAVYDEAEIIADVGSVFVAQATESEPVRISSNSPPAYEYDFEPSAEVSVAGFRLTVESVKTETVEVLRTEPGGVIVYQNGIWSVPPTL